MRERGEARRVGLGVNDCILELISEIELSRRIHVDLPASLRLNQVKSNVLSLPPPKAKTAIGQQKTKSRGLCPQRPRLAHPIRAEEKGGFFVPTCSRKGSGFRRVDMRHIAKKDTSTALCASKNNESPSEGRPRATHRRIKEMAKRLRPLVLQAKGGVDETACLDWAAVALGFKDFEEAKASWADEKRPLFSLVAGKKYKLGTGRCAGKIVKGVFGFKQGEDWILSEKSMLGHEVLFSSTGAGKTETLITKAALAMRANPGMGLLYVDAKGAFSLLTKMLSIAQDLGRPEDLRAINFMGNFINMKTGETRKYSHTFNPIEGFSTAMVSRWLGYVFESDLLSLPVSKEERGVKDLAQTLFETISCIHADLLAAGRAMPGLAGLAQCVEKGRLSSWATDPAAGQTARAWSKRLDALAPPLGAISECAGPSTWSRPVREAMEERLSTWLSSWLSSWPHVLSPVKSDKGEWLRAEINPFSVFDGEIVLALFPALEKSPKELSLLGAMVCASAEVAQEAMKGPWPVRMGAMMMFDECGYYMNECVGSMLSEAKRAGVGIVLASFDLESMLKGCAGDKGREKVMLAAMDSVTIKSCMKIEYLDANMRSFVFDALGAEGLHPSEFDLRDQKEGEAWVAGAGAGGPVRLSYVKLEIPKKVELYRVPSRVLDTNKQGVVQ